MRLRANWATIRAVLMKPRRFAGLEVKIEVKKKPKSAAARWLAKVCNWTVLALFVGFVVWRISLEVRIDARLKRIAARGEPVTASQLNRAYIAVPDHENAALSWLNGFEQRVPKFRPGYPPWSRVTLPGRGKSPSENWFEAAQGFLNSNQAALIAFERAASMEKSRFPVDLANGLLTDTPHLGKLRSSAELLQLEAFVAAEQGDANGAIGSITRILSAARTLRSEPTLMAMLTQSSMDLIAFKSAERLLNCIALTDSQLQQLSKAFADTDNPLRLWQALVGERTMLLSTLAQPKKVLAHDDSANERTKLGNAIAAMLCEITGFFDREVRFLIDAFESNLPLTRLPDPDRFQAREAWNQVEQDSRKGYYLLSGILLPSLPRTIARDCENRARARVIQAVFAIERFRLASEGKLPPNVAALVPQFSPTVPMDPFDGQPLRLRPTPSGYVVYSIGSDAQDDSGAVRTNKKSQGATGDIALLVGR